MGKGFMIVCDGSNGAGKTTVIKAIEAHLNDRGLQAVVTREPGGTVIGEKIRDILLCPDTPEMSDIAELMLFGAARAQHVKEKILPAIQAGKAVVSDRFDAATLSFQHYARGLDLGLVRQINALALDGFRPDMNIILDLDPAIGLERVHQRGERLDRMEAQKLEFLQRARQGYLEQARLDPALFRVLDAGRPLAQVVADALGIVDELIRRHGGGPLDETP
ncbi:dTMP kinase [Pollutimonas sp. M17]|uniref:dTMP kinase n=1 Tax=Pollutimonas sp. M17 TaxID=2962065 RepID=UPI0021F3E635|nr:dTMP kinase [Pollutimonas sp. M17]UYO95382.1 dTMP kinase [Pollutimonas sp. M17]HWK70361.1 dTMP kinase [Burkholderiaceae bacterium]